MDSIHRSLNKGRYVYLVSYDVEGAFDHVPHCHLMQAAEDMGVDVHIRRMIHNWMRSRTFQVKIREASRVYYGSIHEITRGLPQGGSAFPPALIDAVQQNHV